MTNTKKMTTKIFKKKWQIWQTLFMFLIKVYNIYEKQQLQKQKYNKKTNTKTCLTSQNVKKKVKTEKVKYWIMFNWQIL